MPRRRRELTELTEREQELRDTAASMTYSQLQDAAIEALSILRSKTRKDHARARRDACAVLERALGHR